MAENFKNKDNQSDYLQSLEQLLSEVRERFEAQGIKKDEPVRILSGRELKYRGVAQEPPSTNLMDSELVDKLRQAIYQPESFEGTIRIATAKEDVYRVTDGEVKKDKIGIKILRENKQSENISQNTEQSQSLEDIQKTSKEQNQQLEIPEPNQSQAVASQENEQSQSLEDIQKTSKEQNQQLEILEPNQSQTVASQETEQSKSVKNIQQSDEEKQVKLPLADKVEQVIEQKIDQLLSVSRIQKQISVLEQQSQEHKRNSQDSLEIQSEETLKSINNLQSTIQKQQEVINELAQNLKNIVNDDKYSVKSKSSINPENSGLQNFIGNIEHKVKDVAKAILNQIQQFVQPKIDAVKSKVDALKNQVQQIIDGIKNKVDDTRKTVERNVEKAVNTVASNILEAKGRAIEASVGTMLKAIGTKQDNNSITYSSKNYDFRVEGDEISVKRKSDDVQIVNDGVLTLEVSTQDLENIQNIESTAQEYVYEAAKELAQAVATMIYIKEGIELSENDRYSYDHNQYSFDLNLASENPITISLTEDKNIKLFTDGSFTSDALKEDIESIEAIKDIVKEHARNLVVEQQSQQSKGISR